MLRQEFIRLAREKYGDAFEYPHLPDTVKRCVVSIICKTHGKIEVIARDHLRTKYGCPRCADEGKRIPVEKSNQKLLEKAKSKFQDKFDYSKIDLKTSREDKVTIICPIHGAFEVGLRNHSKSETGCMECGSVLNLVNRTKYQTLEDVVKVSRAIHGDKFTYLNYCLQTKILKYSCPLHGEQKQMISSHLRGRGCWGCGLVNRTITADEFVIRASEVHPTGYSYNLAELKSVNDKITMTHECGRVYRCRVSNHLSGQGCMRCKSSSGEAKIRKFLEVNAIRYLDQYKIDGTVYRYDFYLPELNLLIEYDGEQHFRPVDYFGGLEDFEKTRERDRIKTCLAKSRGIALIRVSYKYFDKLEEFLSRAIDRRFHYRVNGVFYRDMICICQALNLPPETNVRELESYRTFNVLKPI